MRRPPARTTGRDSPVRIDSSSVSSVCAHQLAVGDDLVTRPGCAARSPGTTSSTATVRATPSRTTRRRRRDERGEPVERALRAHLLRDPDRRVRDEHAEEERVLPLAEASVAAPATARIRLKTVKTLARTMLAYERLVVWTYGSRSRSRRAASSSVRPRAGCSVTS